MDVTLGYRDCHIDQNSKFAKAPNFIKRNKKKKRKNITNSKKKRLFCRNRILGLSKVQRKELTELVLLLVEYLLFSCNIITMEESNSYISEATQQVKSSKKQPNENAVYNLLLKKLELIDINKEQLTERLNYLAEIKLLQNKQRNGVNSFNVISF